MAEMAIAEPFKPDTDNAGVGRCFLTVYSFAIRCTDHNGKYSRPHGDFRAVFFDLIFSWEVHKWNGHSKFKG